MALNTTYSTDSDVAIKGLVADSRRGFNTITKVAAINTAHGVCVTLNGAGKIVLPSGVNDYIVGATIWTTTLVQDEAGAAVYKAGIATPVTTEDSIYLQARETIAIDALVYAMISGTPGDVKSTQGVTTTTKPIGRAETAATNGNLVKVKLMPAMQG